MAKEWTVEDFLAQASHFQLGHLPTETSHSLTKNLSAMAQSNLQEALAVLNEIDERALDRMLESTAMFHEIRAAVIETLASGGRIFLCGCGATGRLSLSVETLWRELKPENEHDKVRAFMAGGDVALVHSIEGFEDYPEWGARQLLDNGFKENDLLIASTEGGETPWVIGAVQKAADIANRKPFFLFCNPASILKNKIERSRLVLEDPRIRALDLSVGPMALAGSTRMQASTVLMLAAGWAVLQETTDAKTEILSLKSALKNFAIPKIAPFVERESMHYMQGDFLIYRVKDFAITVFTDTTERAPTFSLPSFDNRLQKKAKQSLVYVQVQNTYSAREAWHHLLRREPRPLNWSDVDPRATEKYLAGFDFSESVTTWREELLPNGRHVAFDISRQGSELSLKLEDLEIRAPLVGLSLLGQHLFLKMLLNKHSTLVMGRMGRYYTNLMTHVKPNNAKLIDRAARYVGILLKDVGRGDVSYETIVREIFRLKDQVRDDEAIVLKVFQGLK